jgi:lipopolysaccharide transport system permease protein
VTVYTDLVRYRELFANLFQRELRVKYKGSVLGVAWTLVYPLVLMGVYTVVFSVLWTAFDIPYYPLFLLTGLTVWVFFSAGLQTAAPSLVANANLIKKVRFPRQLVTLSVVGTHLVTLGVMVAVVVPLALWLRPETRTTFWAGLLLLPALVGLTAGVALTVACLNALYRDVEHLVNALLLPWFFLTPVLYTFESLPGAVAQHGTLVDVLHWGNPMVPVVEAIRDPLFFGVLPSVGDALYTVVAAVAALALGAFVFRRADDHLAVEL